MPLKKLRKEIDKLDHDIAKLLHKRKKAIEKVAEVKKKYKMPIFDKKREGEISKKLDKFAKKYGFKKTFLQKIWTAIINESKQVQKKIKK